jgi:hypothetical protein
MLQLQLIQCLLEIMCLFFTIVHAQRDGRATKPRGQEEGIPNLPCAKGGHGPHVPCSRAHSTQHFGLSQSESFALREAFLMPSFPKINSSWLISFLPNLPRKISTCHITIRHQLFNMVSGVFLFVATG